MEKEYIIPIQVPNSESQKKYIFNDGKKTGAITAKDVKGIIEKFLKDVKEDAKTEIIFFGGNFTSLDIEVQEEILKLVNEYMEDRKIKSISLTASPIDINKETIKRLKKYKVKTIELEVLSTSDYILKKAGVDYKFKDIKKASKTIRWNRFNLCYKIIVGLPDSTNIDELNTAKTLIKLKPKSVKIYPMLVTKKTKLEQEYNNQEYTPLTIIQAIEECKTIVRMFVNKNIQIETIGLNDVESKFTNNNEIVAGPFHQEFRKLVESEMWYDAILEKIKQLNVKVKQATILVNPIDEANATGKDNENIKKLKELYDVDLKIKKDEDVKQGKLKVESIKEYNDFLD